MLSWWTVLLLSLGYVALLFGIASWGDKRRTRPFPALARSLIYSLALAVYCTSWTFFGAVGSAASDGWLYLTIYLGPIIVFVFGWPVITRIVSVSKQQNLTSIADFIAARFGKARSLAVLVTLIATAGSVPYIALQLKAVVTGYSIVTNVDSAALGPEAALVVAAGMAVFAIMFGTRQVDVTEHHRGMMLAIAFESVTKLAAFIAVGLFAFLLLRNPGVAAADLSAVNPFDFGALPDAFVTQLLLAGAAILCLPRQFHVTVVEARADADIDAARWVFPLYLALFSIFVVPITIAGLAFLPSGNFSGDMFVLGLPMSNSQDWLTALAFLGGFSAATGMVIVACVALSTMICNEVVIPAMMRLRLFGLPDRSDYTRLLIHVRRMAIIVIAALGYIYYLATDESVALASFGLLSFAAVAQFAPLILFGLYWPRATRRGAIAGLCSGFVLWCFTLFLPALARSGAFSDSFLSDGLFGIALLRPEALLFESAMAPLTHGVAWSVAANVIVLIGISLLTRQTVVEKIQARAFSSSPSSRRRIAGRRASTDITNADLRDLADRFVGKQNASRAFAGFAHEEGIEIKAADYADREVLQFTERLLAGAIGAASARVVMTTALEKSGMDIGDVVLLLDETSQAIRFNRRLLESTLENIPQGVSVIDESQRLIGWNTRYAELFDYPDALLVVGKPVEELIRFNAERGWFGDRDTDEAVSKRLNFMREGRPYRYESEFYDGKVIEIRGVSMPQGGYVSTYTDITEFKAVEQALVDAKAELEQRVADRTAELESTMHALQSAKAKADDANASKSRFLAAAAHDLLQPLNAAKLFSTVLGSKADGMTEEQQGLVGRIESGLVAVEDLLGSLIDIARLDTAAPVPKPEDFPIAELFDALDGQFRPGFAEKNLSLRIADTTHWIRSDPALLRRILQNFLSNARRYTDAGGVLLGCRRRGDRVSIQVIDTGRGIAEEHQHIIFEEFRRLAGSDQSASRGLGLGLAIVERIAQLLGHSVSMTSRPGRGSCFEVVVPMASPVTRARKPSIRKRRPTTALTDQLVLCVDNEPDILDGMRQLLENWGAVPITAANLDDALSACEALRPASPALLIVDYHLDGGLLGTTLIDTICEHLGHMVPAVIVTADHSEKVFEEIRSQQHALLYKPLKPAALRALMTELVSRRETR